MKKFKYFALFVAAGLFAACSDNLNEGNGDNNDGPLTGKGYVNLAINLPTESGSRADEPTFDDGDEAEYKVNDIILAFFNQTDSEADALFLKAFKIDESVFQLDGLTNNQVTSSYSFIFDQVPLEANRLLVILNGGDNVTVGGENNTLTFNTSSSPITVNSSSNFNSMYSNAWQISSDAITSAGNGFMMTNAPLYSSTPSTPSTPSTRTLVPITVSETAEKAIKNTHEVFVERMVAKVEVEKGTNFKETISGGIYDSDKVSLSNWTLNVTNQYTYPVRNVDINDFTFDNSFIGTTNVTADGFVRTYWGKDPNYDEEGNYSYTIYKSDTENNISWKNFANSTNVAYCLENTGTGDTHTYTQTTSVLIKASYYINGDENAQTFFKIGNGTKLYNQVDFITKIKESLSLGSDPSIVENAPAGVYHGYKSPTATNDFSLDELITFNESGVSSDNLYEQLEKLGSISYYANGECYYTVPIQHIGDLNKKTTGKYGVLRNNWYKLTINSVSGPGDPDPDPNPVDPGEGPEEIDPETGYINAKINVLSWAKRTQDVNL